MTDALSSPDSSPVGRPVLPRSLRELLRAFAIATAVPAALVILHVCLERTRGGEHLRRFEYALLEQAPGFDASRSVQRDAASPPLIVDISPTPFDRSQVTDRRMLEELVDTLREHRASAIGLDIDLSPDDQGFIDAKDPQLFDKWTRYGNVRVGVFRRQGDLPGRWLGRPEFQSLAAGIMLPKHDPGHAYLFSSPIVPGASAGSAPGGYLLQMPAALYEIGHAGAAAHLVRDSRRVYSTADSRVTFGQYPVDFSLLDSIQTIPYQQKADLALWRDQIEGRVVLVGDVRDDADARCASSRVEPVPGVLVHAAALATLNNGVLGDIDEWDTLLYNLLCLLGGFSLVYLARSSSRFTAVEPRLADMMCYGGVALFILVFSTVFVGTFRVFWPDFMWIAFGFFIHPYVSDMLTMIAQGLGRGFLAPDPYSRLAEWLRSSPR